MNKLQTVYVPTSKIDMSSTGYVLVYGRSKTPIIEKQAILITQEQFDAYNKCVELLEIICKHNTEMFFVEKSKPTTHTIK